MTNTTITLQQGANVYTYPSTDGNYSFEDVCPGIYQVTLSTGKPVGGINATDAAQVSAWSLNPLETDMVRFLAGDVVGPTTPGSFMEIRSNDASRILDYFVLGQTLIPAWEFWEAGTKVSDIEVESKALEIDIPAPTVSVNSVTRNFLALVSGDFNRNFVPNILLSASASETLTLLQGEDVPVQPFTTVDIPITAGTSMQVSAISLILSYPEDKLQVEGVFLQNNPDLPVLFNATHGELRIGWNSINPISLGTGETMLTVRLKATTHMVEGEVSHFKLAINSDNELADGRYEVIQNATLKMDGLKLEKSVTTGIEMPDRTSQMLLTAYPNPFREYAKIKYTLPEDGSVKIEVTGVLGNRVRELTNQQQAAGEYLMNLEGDNIVPGVYQITLRFKNQYGKEFTQTIRMIKQ
jgi:hypothetical protein